MAQQLARVICGFGCVISLLLTSPAEAQLVRVRRGGGEVHVRAPFVRVDVWPGGATSVRAPFTAVDSPGRVYVGPRGRLLGPYGRQAVVQARPFPSKQDLAAMDDVALFATLRDVSMRLNLRLARLNTGAGWQRYLALSEEALGGPASESNAGLPPTIRVDLLQNALVRFDRTAENPEYLKIATLPSFVATQATLRKVVERFAGPQIIEPSGANSPRTEAPSKPQDLDQNELLPTPAPEPRPATSSGERSILRRAARG